MLNICIEFSLFGKDDHYRIGREGFYTCPVLVL